MLCAFFPEGTEEAVFSDLSSSDPLYPLFRTAAERGWIESGPQVPARPDEELTRLEFAVIMNRILGRGGDREDRGKMVGTFLDVRRDDPHFWDVAEAVIPHKSFGQGAEERWTRSTALPLREEGFFFLGPELHAIDADGSPAVNCEYAGLFFDANGVQTSGDPELDALILDVLQKQVDPQTMSREEMLEKLYTYTILDFAYRPGNFYPFGDTSNWAAVEARSMLEEGRGNCYGFAALFCELARAIGYDARPCTGAIIAREEFAETHVTDVYGNPLDLPAQHIPHGWVEIDLDGETWIFDPEYAYRFYHRGKWNSDFYKMDAYNRVRYGYMTELEETPQP